MHSYTLDEVDIKILQLLQENARLTNKEIGEKLHKTSSPIFDRVKRMQEFGIIRGYIAVLDHTKIDRRTMAFTHVQLKDHSGDILESFEQEIIQFDEVVECYHMSGQYDFILRIAVSDLESYHHFLMKKLFQLKIVGSVQSTFVMKEAKRDLGYKLTVPKRAAV
ncbi:Lrp/AsnC family transcriptional regulator [Mucilaginibacter corticis]|uniref:Lrp/AsnC family transcriptional regulator n=1 Tax=Mucilaginibacter corticis TaxID=2597670 RepID=A0A556MIF2_9SPHI|nr:Lrp/AsnC family transcriptional regulator [Mucilaginibacter corticis]TSJ39694.1 Lrp/AsnC family transcriptional regulator [Mucilaginibacter corticis]